MANESSLEGSTPFSFLMSLYSCGEPASFQASERPLGGKRQRFLNGASLLQQVGLHHRGPIPGIRPRSRAFPDQTRPAPFPDSVSRVWIQDAEPRFSYTLDVRLSPKLARKLKLRPRQVSAVWCAHGDAVAQLHPPVLGRLGGYPPCIPRSSPEPPSSPSSVFEALTPVLQFALRFPFGLRTM